MLPIKDLLKNSKFLQKQEETKPARLVKPWQGHAVAMAKKLHIKPTTNWFRFFKVAYMRGQENLLDAVYSSLADSDCRDQEKLFYWQFYKFLKERKK